MSDQSNSIHQQGNVPLGAVINQTPFTSYQQSGFQAAQNSQSNPDAIGGFLNVVYDRFWRVRD